MANQNEQINPASIAEKFFQSMDIIFDARMKEIGYDKTIVCTITDASSAAEGEYLVSDGQNSFYAYSSDTTFKKNTQVYVTIPSGDMLNQKVILGKYTVTDSENQQPYVSPIQDFVNITGDLVDKESKKSYSLLANYGNGLGSSVDQNKIIQLIWSKDNLNYRGFTKLGLKAEFVTWLKEVGVKNGIYGLRIIIYGQVQHEIIVDQALTAQLESYSTMYDFNNKDMYGDPYNFFEYFSQETSFDVSEFAQIDKIEVYFYQNQDFCDQSGNLIPWRDEKTSWVYADNIFVRNLEIGVGYSLSEFTEDTVLVGTLGSLTYSQIQSGDALKRDIYLRWVRVIDGNLYAIDEWAEFPEDAAIKWYEYQGGAEQLLGDSWVLREDLKGFNIQVVLDKTLNFNKFKAVIELPSSEYLIDSLYDNTIIDNRIKYIEKLQEKYTNERYDVVNYLFGDAFNSQSNLINYLSELNIDFFEVNLGNDEELNVEDKTNEEIRQIRINFIKETGNLILGIKNSGLKQTAEIVFQNQIITPSQSKETSLYIECDIKGTKGIYKLYNQDSKELIKKSAAADRILTAHFSSDIANFNESPLSRASKITWKFPKNNTMIVLDPSGYSDAEFSEDEEYYFVTRIGTESYAVADAGKQQINSDQNFRIANNYNENYTNNTIICEIVKNGIIYSAETTLQFGLYVGDDVGTYSLVKMYRVDGNNFDKKIKEIFAANYNGEYIDQYILIEAQIYNNLGESQDLTNIVFDWSLYNTSNTVWEKPYSICGYDNNKLFLERNNKATIENNYLVLQCKCTYDGEKLLTMFSVPINMSKYDDYFYDGIEEIIYDSYGSKTSYYKEPCKIISKEKEEVSDIVFELISSEDITYYPTWKNGTAVLDVPNMFLNNLRYECCICAKKDDVYIWSQPLLIMQNKYSSKILNDWDETLKIDEKNGIILSKMLGAGQKESDNTFSGVLLGDVKHESGDKATDTGLYGFHHGAQSFGFNVDGTAFIGKSGFGRIYFDGNKGTIESGNFDKLKATGMQIDLDGNDNVSSSLSMYGKKGGLEVNTAGNQLFRLFGYDIEENKKSLLSIGDEYVLQTLNYTKQTSDQVGQGVRIDMSEGLIDAYSFKIQAIKSGTTNQKIIIDSSAETYPFKIGDGLDISSKFKISWDGTLYASGGQFKDGEISGGSIVIPFGDGTLKDDADNVINFFEVNQGGIKMCPYIPDITNNPNVYSYGFTVNSQGTLSVIDGTIGGWIIGKETLTSGDSTGGIIQLFTGNEEEINGKKVKNKAYISIGTGTWSPASITYEKVNSSNKEDFAKGIYYIKTSNDVYINATGDYDSKQTYYIRKISSGTNTIKNKFFVDSSGSLSVQKIDSNQIKVNKITANDITSGSFTGYLYGSISGYSSGVRGYSNQSITSSSGAVYTVLGY